MTSPPTAAQIEEIRKRHEQAGLNPHIRCSDDWKDAATLLAALDARKQPSGLMASADRLATYLLRATDRKYGMECIEGAIELGIIRPVPSEDELTALVETLSDNVSSRTFAKAIRSLLLGESKEGRD